MPDLPSTAAKRESWLKRAINLLIDVRPVTTDGEDDDLFCFTWQIRVTPAQNKYFLTRVKSPIFFYLKKIVHDLSDLLAKFLIFLPIRTGLEKIRSNPKKFKFVYV